jgi:formylglycine-generating enzyme required for sulfatase activity
LCKDHNLDDLVVVKALLSSDLERGIADVFAEGQALRRLNHPAIIRLWDCGFADAVNRNRPFLVMEYFDGMTLEEYVSRHGPLPPPDLLPVAHAVAEGLHAAHARGIWHRDVKPANLLLRRGPEGAGEPTWEVKLIDFGLALKQSVIQATVSKPVARTCVLGYSVAGTLDYAAPEQLGKLEGVAVGPYSDVYGFGKTLCYALFKTVQPLRKHWRSVPEPFADLLEQCLEENPGDRPKQFAEVLQRMGTIKTGGAGAVAAPRTGRDMEAMGPTVTPLPKPLSPVPVRQGKTVEARPIFTNSLGMRLALIPPGTFLMGAPEAENQAQEDERPQHGATITKPFHLGVYPVTVGNFRRFTQAAEFLTEAQRDGKGAYAWTGKEWKLHPQINWQNPGWTLSQEEPVVCVSWNDAKAFCDWLSSKEGRFYRLPTEAEWEYACRAGTSSPFCLGNSLSSSQANFDGRSPYGGAATGRFLKSASKVGAYLPNAFGLYDVHGNVWEWCADWYNENYYKGCPELDPHGSTEGTLRVMRGGSWQSAGKDCRAARRYGGAPGYRSTCIGFRVVSAAEAP